MNYWMHTDEDGRVTRGLTRGQGDTLTAMAGGRVALDEGSHDYLAGMAEAAYGCGDSLAGASYAASAADAWRRDRSQA